MEASIATLLALTILVSSSAAADVQMRWCYTADEKMKCEALMKNLTEYAKTNMSMTLNASCVEAKDASECMDKIKDKQADLVTLDGGQILLAGKDHSMEVVVAEDYGQGLGTSYFAVAVAKKSSSFGIKDLKGKKSCHTGAGRTAGWVMPVGFLLSKDIMKRQGSSCNPYLDAGKFFSESCVPGALTKEYNPKDENPNNLCSICGGEGDSKCAMSSNEPYFGYAGAFKCMAKGKGDVAFVKHTTTKEMTEGTPGEYGNESDYEYLCQDGSRKAIGKHADCNLGTSPSHAVMTWNGNPDRADYIKLLVKASGPDGADFQMFDSAQYGGKNLLFKDSTQKLVDVGNKKTYTTYLDQQYLDDVEAIKKCDEPTSASAALAPFASFVVALAIFAAM